MSFMSHVTGKLLAVVIHMSLPVASVTRTTMSGTRVSSDSTSKLTSPSRNAGILSATRSTTLFWPTMNVMVRLASLPSMSYTV